MKVRYVIVAVLCGLSLACGGSSSSGKDAGNSSSFTCCVNGQNYNCGNATDAENCNGGTCVSTTMNSNGMCN